MTPYQGDVVQAGAMTASVTTERAQSWRFPKDNEGPVWAVSYTASVKAVRLLWRLRSNKLPDRSQPACRFDLETAGKSYSVSYVFAKTIETLSKTLSRATLC